MRDLLSFFRSAPEIFTIALPIFVLFFANFAELIKCFSRTLLCALNFFFLTINCKTVARGFGVVSRIQSRRDLSLFSASRLEPKTLRHCDSTAVAGSLNFSIYRNGIAAALWRNVSPRRTMAIAKRCSNSIEWREKRNQS